MACEDFPTAQNAKDFKTNADTINEVVTSQDDFTPPAIDGNPKTTLAKIDRDAKAAYSGANGIDKGAYAIGVVFENYNDYCTYDSGGTLQQWSPKPTTALPYTATLADPNTDTNLTLRGDASQTWVRNNFSNTNLLTNSGFQIEGDGTQPALGPVARDVLPGEQPKSNWFGDEDFGCANVTFVNGVLSFPDDGVSKLYQPVPKSAGLQYVTELVASIAVDSNGLPVEAGIDYITDPNDSTRWLVQLTGGTYKSAKLEQGDKATKHEAEVYQRAITFNTVAEMIAGNPPVGSVALTSSYYADKIGGGEYKIELTGSGNSVDSIDLGGGRYANLLNPDEYNFDPLLTDGNRSDAIIQRGVGVTVLNNNFVNNLSFFPQPIDTRAHKGLSAFALEYEDESFGIITRHAGLHYEDNNGKIVGYKLEFGGRSATYGYTTEIQNVTSSDDRDAAIGYMSNGRVGMIGLTNGNPNAVFSYSDDNGKSWATIQATGVSNYFGSVDKIHNIPASAGGSDNTFIAYGNDFIATDPEKKLVAAITSDNGLTWTQSDIITGLANNTSEWTIERIGDNDFWVATARQNIDGGAPVFSTSTDMINWTPIQYGTLALDRNPSTLVYVDGYLYFFATFRNREWDSPQPNQAYKGKIVYSRTKAWKALSGDFSELNNISVLGGGDNFLGYFRFLRSPVSGKMHAIVATRELDRRISGEWRKDFVMASDLVLITNEKIIDTDSIPDNFLADTATTGDTWDVVNDRRGNRIAAYLNNARLTGDNSNNFSKSFELPRNVEWERGATEYNVSITWTGSNSATPSGNHQIRVTNKTQTGFDVVFFTDATQAPVNWVDIDISVNGRGFYPRQK